MKKSIFLVVSCLFFAAMSVNAQTQFKPFRVDIGLGYAIANGGGGVLFNLEPKYAVIPQLSVGLKLEADLIIRDIKVDDKGKETIAEATAQGISSYLLTADYHLTQKSFRPFVGAGFGLYSIAAAKASGTSSESTLLGEGSSTNFGAMLRAGFDVGHFRLALAYHFAGKDAVKSNTGFFSTTVGVYIGGGKKR